MKKTIKGFVLGLIIATLLMGTALGAGVKKTIEVAFDSVNLTVNGKKVDAETIVYNETTYVPLRAAAEMLDKDVGWDQATQTASINDKVVEEPVVKEKEDPIQSGEETLSQKNAVKKAESYLSTSAFSKSGLIGQLEYSGFSSEDANYAVNKINVDWKEQAVKKAESYLSTSAFSRSRLIEQLEYSGFSNEEAVYAVDEIGL